MLQSPVEPAETQQKRRSNFPVIGPVVRPPITDTHTHTHTHSRLASRSLTARCFPSRFCSYQAHVHHPYLFPQLTRLHAWKHTNASHTTNALTEGIYLFRWRHLTRSKRVGGGIECEK
ncbi:hypothetical protein LZ32DRAFT_47657 [Colletotrichum eremochloae]|nr:hypothetical protein LZ32DRAFT_47657 [Colletotrichum eremochloae]